MNPTPNGHVDPFATFGGAYVLGALTPGERAEFEEHLRHCEECARSVRELAGLPGLLAQVESPATLRSHPPPELLPGLLAKVRGQRRRRLVGGVAAVAVAVAACVALLLIALPGGGPSGPAGTAMTPLGAYPVQASVRLTEADWGTRIEMSCSYDGSKGGDYVLVAVRPDGTATRLASWYAVPDDTAELTIGTPLNRAEITALEVRLPDGPVLLRLPVSG
ncbi:hypothetical protein SacmaDRAFT_3359 [Saccharomonospora marina XMU15]|uniref:Putative zinc-finger domain-containing protein n=1 Tax=Saccharomonospora marina XMU15 TaxID=882083 RepID=H5XBK9_9PSEU|nr:zf-HC2 domain-containing protein [Saccharomonospora marina]EHR51584.1 hypothetical protein SacmaDRAFT_3359 [Saccharomonospora marina XMU15]